MNKDIIKSLAILTAMKGNLPSNIVSAKYAQEFNSTLDILGNSTGESLSEFKVPSSEMQPRPGYSAGMVQREYLLMKIESVLGYFSMALQPNEIKDKIGFHIEEN